MFYYCRLFLNKQVSKHKRIVLNIISDHSVPVYPIVVPKRYIESISSTSTTCKNLVRGIDYLWQPRLNKGLAFTLEERQALGLHGLLAAKFKTLEEQVALASLSIDRYQEDLNKYIFLIELQDINEKLFFNLLAKDIAKYLPIVYTPTVGLACQRFGLVYRRTRGLFITIHDKGRIQKIIDNWPEHDVRAIVFTDGERILGLGDLGAYGMGIPIGKLNLYTALGGIKPHQCLPIILDVGTDNETLLADPLYIGLQHKRVRGKEYDEFMDEFMQACAFRFGPNTLLQFEDFAYANAARLLEKYKDHYCTFNDDIQGTASVAVAGLFAAMRITKKKLSENIYMFLGAGSAAMGIANLITAAMVEEGVSIKEAYSKIYMFDVDGLVTSKRDGGVPALAANFGKDCEPETDFENAVKNIKPACLIGCSTVGGAFTPAILKQMANNTERPVIFALSNPTIKAECTAQAAYDNTEGRCIFASGSPFPPVQYQGKNYQTGQGNNAYIFPGIALAAIATCAHCIPDYLFLEAARTLAHLVSEEDLAEGRIYPPLADLKKVSYAIAQAVAEMTYVKDVATVHPKPRDLAKWIDLHLYSLKYDDYRPTLYAYPELPEYQVKTVEDAYKGLMLVLRQQRTENLTRRYDVQLCCKSLIE